MKRLSLSLAVVILALSSAVSASDFEEDKQYISCRKGAVNDRQLTACQERLLERLDMSIAKALDRNMTLLAESERITAQRYQLPITMGKLASKSLRLFTPQTK